jgi:hypothetical protein
MKRLYDRKYIPISFEIGEWVMLRLYRGYTVGSTLSRKLSNQYAGPYTVLEKIGNLAYCLDFHPESCLYPVVLVAYLEKMPQSNDPYGRVEDEPGLVEVDGKALDDRFRSYEIEALVRKEWKDGLPRYLVKWLGWLDQHNAW